MNGAMDDGAHQAEGEGDRGPVPGIDEEPVSAWLDEHISGARGPYRFEFITGGHSNLTYKVTAADGMRLVLRRPPLGAVLATAHDMGREHRIISGVGNTDVPVPPALGLCDDDTVNGAPFYIMGFVDGAVLHDAEVADTHMPEHAARAILSHSVVDVLGTLHTAEPDRIGLGDLGRKEAYLDRQLKRWKSQWESSKTRELPAMDRAYERLMEHWKSVLQLPVMEVKYEELVANPEPAMRALIEFCGLEWDDRCLRFHESDRPVTTPSYDQVRRPVYGSSVGRWRNYRAQLQPLFSALEEEEQ